MGPFNLTGIAVSADIVAGASILLTGMIGVCGYFIGLNKKVSAKKEEQTIENRLLLAQLFQHIEPFYQRFSTIHQYILESYKTNNNSIPDADEEIIRHKLSTLYNEIFQKMNQLRNELILKADEELYLKVVTKISTLEQAIKKAASRITGTNINNITYCFMELEKELLSPTCTDKMLNNYLTSKYPQ